MDFSSSEQDPSEPAVELMRTPDAIRLAGEHVVALTGEDGLLMTSTKQVLQTVLEAEMTAHLGYGKHAITRHGRGGGRNGTTPKTVTTEIGQISLVAPRGRAGPSLPRLCRSIGVGSRTSMRP